MPKGIPLTEEQQALRRQEIFDAAVHLFIEKGFLETSMREIAIAADVGKSTLYDYFATKDDILVSFFENELQIINRRTSDITQTSLPVDEKLRRILRSHLEYLLSNKNFYLRLTFEAQRLNMHSQQRIQAGRHAYQDLVCSLIKQGIEEGIFRPVDPLLAMRILLASITPVAFTTRPSGTPQEMLAAAIDIVFEGLRA